MDGSRVPTLIPKRRACINCTSAKARCVPRADNVCERCSRKSSKCLYLDLPDRKRRQGDSNRIAALENKIDTLVAQLSVRAREGVSPTSDSPTSVPSTSSGQGVLSSVPNSTITRSSQFLPTSDSISVSEETLNDRAFDDVIEDGLISRQDAVARLRSFQKDYVPYFPFVPIHATETLDVLRHGYPTTFLAIMAVTESYRSSVQSLLGQKLWRQVSSRVLHGESNFDMLRALLIYAGWFQYFCGKEKPQVFLLIQVCTTLLHELGLERRPVGNFEKGDAATGVTDFRQHRDPFSDSVATSNGKRALLGTFLFSVSTAKGLRKPCSMRFTSYMAECCREFSIQSEYSTDKLIEPLICLQSLNARVSDVFGYYDPSMASIHGDGALHFTIGALIRELNPVKDMISHLESGSATEHLCMEVQYLQSWMYEIVFHDELWKTETVQRNSNYTGFGIDNLGVVSSIRGNMLWRLLEANNRFIQGFLALPNQQLRFLCLSSFNMLCYVLISQAKLVFTFLDRLVDGSMTGGNEEHMSISQMVIARAGYPVACAAIIEKFETILTTEDDQVDPMLRFCNITKAMMMGYLNQLQDRLGPTATLSNMSGEGPTQQSLAAGLVHPEAQGGDPHIHGGIRSVEAENYGNIGVMPTESAGVFDEMVWETILNEFTLPFPG